MVLGTYVLGGKKMLSIVLVNHLQEVSSQLWATLYDYPCLKSCAGLHQYICDAVRLAWALVNQVNIS